MRHLISLGQNCDVAFQLRMHGRENVPHFFDWLGTPAAALPKIFAADFDVFRAEDLVYRTNNSSHYVQDAPTGVAFFHQFPYVSGHTTQDFMLFYGGFIKNFKFQARRFREYVQTLPVTLVRRNIKHDEAVALEDAFFALFPSADAQFLYLVHDKNEFKTSHGHARHIPVTRGSLGDPEAWSKLLLAEGLIETPYRHSTVEILGASHADHSLSPEDRFGEEQLLAAITGNPEHPLFLLELARYYRKRSKHADAELQALRALSLAPDKAESQYELTMARWRGEKLPAAEAAQMLAAISKRGQIDDLLVETANAFLEAGDLEQAVEYALKAINQNPMSHRAYYTRSIGLYRQGKVTAAERAMAGAVRSWGRLPHYFHMQARFLEELGRLEEAVAVLRKAVAITPDFHSFSHLGKLLKRLGRNAEAVEAWQQALPIAGKQQETVQRWIDSLQPQPEPELAPG